MRTGEGGSRPMPPARSLRPARIKAARSRPLPSGHKAQARHKTQDLSHPAHISLPDHGGPSRGISKDMSKYLDLGVCLSSSAAAVKRRRSCTWAGTDAAGAGASPGQSARPPFGRPQLGQVRPKDPRRDSARAARDAPVGKKHRARTACAARARRGVSPAQGRRVSCLTQATYI